MPGRGYLKPDQSFIMKMNLIRYDIPLLQLHSIPFLAVKTGIYNIYDRFKNLIPIPMLRML
jgi:hypothetical protein